MDEFYYCFAISTSLAKPAASFTARSASILRLTSMFCFFRPAMKVAFVEEGDIIEIDINNYSINLRVSDEELAKRKANWTPKEPKVTTGYLARYAKMVTSGNRGGVLEIKE